jgi:hypothetical protein
LKLSQKELNEYRRIKYNQQKRELTQEEKERLIYFKATFKLSSLSQSGYDFEIKDTLHKLIEFGLETNIIYHNPIDPFEWKHTRKKGVDLIMRVGEYILYVEMTCLGAYYPYRREWFIESRIPRFEGCPKPSDFVFWIVLTNRPENFNSVKSLASEYSISIMSIENILSLISTLTITNKQLTTN